VPIYFIHSRFSFRYARVYTDSLINAKIDLADLASNIYIIFVINFYDLSWKPLLQIEDRRTELYVGDSFPGQGYRLGKHSPMDLLSTSSHKSSSVLQRSDRIIPSMKDSVGTSENIPLLSLPTSRYYHYLTSEQIVVMWFTLIQVSRLRINMLSFVLNKFSLAHIDFSRYIKLQISKFWSVDKLIKRFCSSVAVDWSPKLLRKTPLLIYSL